ncbi:hypothetical protein [Butyricimonas virosa]|uniref:hypothetical protein n=1 Tax=Butyricimonas virosa TaxID=544645 RepID=UPI0024309E2E|nr:hypothetical protein [Butyricimonas virosa]
MSLRREIRLVHTRRISTKEHENSEYYEFEFDGNIVCEVFDDEDLLVIRELIDQVVAEKEGKEVHHG